MIVSVVPHDPSWAMAFETEARDIMKTLGNRIIALHHIGSTSVPGILAKPIIDMLGIAEDLRIMDRLSSSMENLGYEVMGEFGIEGRRYYRKSDCAGHRSHHLHVFATGSPHIERHIAFRDYLRSNPDKAREYSELKAKIAGRGVSSAEYVDAKAPFIARTEMEAVNWCRRIRSDAIFR